MTDAVEVDLLAHEDARADLGYVLRMMLPKPRGSLSEWLCQELRVVSEGRSSDLDAAARVTGDDVDDRAIALWMLHELSYAGFDDVPDMAETDPLVIVTRARLEQQLEQRLRARWSPVPVAPEDVADALVALVAADDGPSLADHVRRRADRDEALELLRQRSIYHLNEADPSTWVVPRLPVRSKAALMELQFDEYGDGDPNRLHARLFARGMDAAGLRSERGAYVDDALPRCWR